MICAPREQDCGSAAFTRAELLAIAAVLVIVIAFFAEKNSLSRSKQQSAACVKNLKEIGLAFRISISDGGDRFPFEISTNYGGTKEFTNVWQHFIVLSNELSQPKIFICPASRKSPAPSLQFFSDQNVSYFVGLSAVETYPQSWLAGDEGLLFDGRPSQSNPIDLSTNANISYPRSIHRAVANIAMGDGSVQQLDRDQLKQWLRNTGLDANVLLLPR